MKPQQCNLQSSFVQITYRPYDDAYLRRAAGEGTGIGRCRPCTRSPINCQDMACTLATLRWPGSQEKGYGGGRGRMQGSRHTMIARGI